MLYKLVSFHGSFTSCTLLVLFSQCFVLEFFLFMPKGVCSLFPSTSAESADWKCDKTTVNKKKQIPNRCSSYYRCQWKGIDDYDFEVVQCAGNRIFDEILGECVQEQLATVPLDHVRCSKSQLEIGSPAEMKTLADKNENIKNSSVKTSVNEFPKPLIKFEMKSKDSKIVPKISPVISPLTITGPPKQQKVSLIEPDKLNNGSPSKMLSPTIKPNKWIMVHEPFVKPLNVAGKHLVSSNNWHGT